MDKQNKQSTAIRVTPSYVPERILSLMEGVRATVPVDVGGGFYAWNCLGEFEGMIGLGRYDNGPVSHKQLHEAGFYDNTTDTGEYEEPLFV